MRLTRGGPAKLSMQGVEAALGFSSDDRKRLTFGVDGSIKHANSTATGRFAPGQSFDELLAMPADNILMAKLTWWWNPS